MPGPQPSEEFTSTWATCQDQKGREPSDLHSNYSPPSLSATRHSVDAIGGHALAQSATRYHPGQHAAHQASSQNVRISSALTAASHVADVSKGRHPHYSQPQHSYSQPQSHLQSPHTHAPHPPPPGAPGGEAGAVAAGGAPMYHSTHSANYSSHLSPSSPTPASTSSIPPQHIPGYYHESPSQMGGRNSSQQGYYYQRHPSYAHSTPHHHPSLSVSIPPQSHSQRLYSASSSPVTAPGVRPTFSQSRPLTAEEKEIKRKVSHSAIEKRRRERTNAVLRELQNIVPGLCKPGKIQKLEILEAAAEYIRQLSAMPGLPQQRMGGGLPSHLSPQSSSHHYPQYVPHMQQFRQYTGPPVTAHDEPKDMRSESADQHQHQSVATPMSVSSGTIHEDLPDDSLQSALSDPGSSPSDPSSMKVNFLLC